MDRHGLGSTPGTYIAHDLDYHDQMHLIHDFLALAGDTPGRILRRVHADYRIGVS